MAENEAGSIFIRVIPEMTRAQLTAVIEEASKGVTIDIPVTFKMQKGAVGVLVKEAKVDLAKRKDLPSLGVKLKVAKGEVKSAIASANAHIKTLKQKPSLNVGLSVTDTEARRAITEANARLKAAKVAAPKLKVELDLDERQAALLRELQVEVKSISASIPHIDIEVDLDQKSMDAIARKAYGAYLAAQGKIDAAHARRIELREIAEEQSAGRVAGNIVGQHSELEKLIEVRDAQLLSSRLSREDESQTKLNQKVRAGLDARTLEELRQVNRVALIHERAENAKRASSTHTFRQLRNDLSQFDASSTRLLRHATIGFGLFTAGVAAAFAGATAAALASFGRTELAIARTAAVLASNDFVQAMDGNAGATDKFNSSVASLKKELQAITEKVAVETIFNPTEIAEGAKALAQAGLDVKQIKANLQGVSEFAQNQEIDLAKATEGLTGGAFASGIKLTGDALTDLADKFTFVANATNASAVDIADAFSNKAAPQFRAYGQSIEQTLTVLALFAKANVRGKTAGEQAGILVRFISQAANKTDETRAAFKKYGIQIGKVNGVTVPFTKTLFQLAQAKKLVDKEADGQGFVRLQKQLGLTQKSASGLNQLLPQIEDLGADGMAKFEKQIKRSTGALHVQSSVITNTLGFQFEKLTNEIGSLSRVASGPLADSLTKTFLKLNGDAKGSVGIAKQLRGEVEKIGVAVAAKLGPAFDRFASGGEGADFLKGISEGTKGTLRGLLNAFGEFRNEVFGEGSNKGFFSTLGDAFAALGRFSEKTLPRIGRGLGIIVGFVRDNKDAVKAMIAAWLGLFFASKALRLLIIPIVSLTDQTGFLRKAMASVIKLQFAQSILSSSGVLEAFTRNTRAATTATNALAAAEARQAAAQAASAAAPAGGFNAFSKKATAVTAGAEVARLTPKLTGLPGVMAKIEKSLLGVGRIFPSFIKGIPVLARLGSGFARLAGPVGLIILAAEAAIGVFKGFFEEIGRGSKGNGEFARSMSELRPIIKVVFDVLRDIIGVVGRVGQAIGHVFGGIFRAAIVNAGDQLRGFKALVHLDLIGALKAFGDVIVNSITLPFRLAIGFVLDMAASALGSLKSLDPTGHIKKMQDGLLRAGRATRDFTLDMSKAEGQAKRAGSAVASIPIVSSRVPKFLKDTRTNTFVLNQEWARSRRFAALFSRSINLIEGNARTAAGGIDIATAALSRFSEAMRQQNADKAFQSAFDAEIRSSKLGAITADSQTDALIRAGNAGAVARQRALGLFPAVKLATKATEDLIKTGNGKGAGGGGTGGGAGGGGEAVKDISSAAKEVKTAAELAEAAVSKLSIAQFKGQSSALIGRIGKTAGAYKATAFESALLAKAMPAVDRAMETQKAAVEKLNTALTELQATQLEGTKAFSDQNFALDQQIKTIQLQKLDLQIAGTSAEDPGIKALDAQIAALQQQTERVSLVESLQLDPLKRKLEETFTPVKELSFQKIIDQFAALNQQKVVLDARVGKGETLKSKLDAVVAGAADKFASVGLSVTQGINAGLNAGKPAIVKGARDTANAIVRTTDAALGIASPSRVMALRGAAISQGLQVGMASERENVLVSVRSVRTAMLTIFDNGIIAFVERGKDVMRGFRGGMSVVYKQEVQPFVLSIAEWIKNNKGPISYDAQLLRPAGAAMMSGFHKGLADGFGEVKGWVKKVGPMIDDTFPDKLMFKRSAQFLINNAKADATFNPDDAFGDLLPTMLGSIGAFDPTLSFLHKTLSLADTEEMARKLIALNPSMNLGALKFDHNKFVAGTDRISDHFEGVAADLGTGTNHPTFASLQLFEKLKPLMGTIFKQLIHNGLGLSAGGGTFSDSNHADHIHASWLKGPGFDIFSGRKGVGMLNIPGVPADVLNAISVASQKLSFDPRIIAAVMKQESGYRKNVVSGDGGYGLMQLTSSNLVAAADALGGRLDPVANALVGTKYLKDLVNQLGSLKLGLSAYNSGPGGGERFGRVDVPSYVASVMRFLEEIKRLTGGVGTFRAQGGPLNANQASWVGERGRELWIPDRSGTVISNRNVEAMMRMTQAAPATQVAGATYSPTFQVSSNSPDPAVVASLVDARMRAQTVGVRN